ncbi:MAG: hypothetical protein P4M00_08035 [Azospirillaceae bacterium]|nr:hypothetical protein [Azospirillaceae bacterium]
MFDAFNTIGEAVKTDLKPGISFYQSAGLTNNGRLSLFQGRQPQSHVPHVFAYERYIGPKGSEVLQEQVFNFSHRFGSIIIRG